MTTSTTTTTSSIYSFRETTQQMHELSLNRTPVRPTTSRTVLSIHETASRVREKEHDCDVLETDHIVNKVAARLFHSLFRFSLSHAFNCHTRRGHTHLSGARSHCGGCEAAHAALSPTLYDDILDTISAKLSEKPFPELETAEKEYLIQRFKLGTSEIEALSSKSQDSRIKTLISIVARLSVVEKKGTFVGTATEQVRNATYDNSKDSNRFDCHLENNLRPEEDQLAEECRLNTKTPTQALQSLQERYRSLVEIAIPNLKNKLTLIGDLESSWEKLLNCQSNLETLTSGTDKFAEEFQIYLKLVDIYLKVYENFFIKQPGTPTFAKFQKYLIEAQSPFTLRRALREKNTASFSTYLKFLLKPIDWKDSFQKAKRSIERRLYEAQHQLLVLHQTPDEIKGMLKHLFGAVNSTGVLTTPSKEDIAVRIVHLVQPVTPMRTDLHKPKSTNETT